MGLNGTALAWSYSGPLDDCYHPNEGVALQVPGRPRRVVMRPGQRQLVRWHETPDGRHVAIEAEPGEERAPERRGKRRPWPKEI